MTDSNPRHVVEYVWKMSSPCRTKLLNPGLSVRYPARSVPDERAFCSTTGGNAPFRSSREGSATRATAARDCSSVCEKPRSKLKWLIDDETHGTVQPMRRR